MKNLLNIIFSVIRTLGLFGWILGGLLLPVLHLIDSYFYGIPEIKEMTLTTMLYCFVLLVPVGLYGLFTNESPKMGSPSDGGKIVKGKKPGCSSCKKKK